MVTWILHHFFLDYEVIFLLVTDHYPLVTLLCGYSSLDYAIIFSLVMRSFFLLVMDHCPLVMRFFLGHAIISFFVKRSI